MSERGDGEVKIGRLWHVLSAYTVVPFFVLITLTSVSLDTVARRLLLVSETNVTSHTHSVDMLVSQLTPKEQMPFYELVSGADCSRQRGSLLHPSCQPSPLCQTVILHKREFEITIYIL